MLMCKVRVGNVSLSALADCSSSYVRDTNRHWYAITRLRFAFHRSDH